MRLKYCVSLLICLSLSAENYELDNNDLETDAEKIVRQLLSHPAPHNYIFSYPHSGNTWLRYCIEVLTQTPTADYNPDPGFLALHCGYTCGHPVDFSKKPIWKVHDASQLNHPACPCDTRRDNLIFLIRNPKEAVLRYIGDADMSTLFEGNSLGKLMLYFEDLYIFDQWRGPKMIVYYEDFMINPGFILEHTTRFLNNYDSDEINWFLQKYETHKSKGLKLYDNFFGSNTQGNDLLHYSRKLSRADRKKIDLWIEQTYPAMWEKYIKNSYSEEALEKRGFYEHQVINRKHFYFEN